MEGILGVVVFALGVAFGVGVYNWGSDLGEDGDGYTERMEKDLLERGAKLKALERGITNRIDKSQELLEKAESQVSLLKQCFMFIEEHDKENISLDQMKAAVKGCLYEYNQNK